MKLPQRLLPYAAYFEASGARHGVEAVLLAAICDRESGGGAYLTPLGPSGTGDGGHGRGLMQVDDRSWGIWLADNDWRDAATNIDKGAEILKASIDACHGDVLAGIAGYNAGARRAWAAKPTGGSILEVLAALDGVTTGGDYVTDVLHRVSLFRRK